MVLGKTASATINFNKLTLLKSTCHMLDIMVRNQMQHLKDASSRRNSRGIRLKAVHSKKCKMYLKSEQNHTVKYPKATYMYIHIKLKPHANIVNDKATFQAFTAGIQS